MYTVRTCLFDVRAIDQEYSCSSNFKIWLHALKLEAFQHQSIPLLPCRRVNSTDVHIQLLHRTALSRTRNRFRLFAIV